MAKHKKTPRRPRSQNDSQKFNGLNDPALLEFIRSGQIGAQVRDRKALSNMAVLRCVSLISQTVGMLPLNLIERGESKQTAQNHPAFYLLKYQPNTYQTAYTFKTLMQSWVLLYGNAYAKIVRGVGGKVMALHPIHPNQVQVEQNDDFSIKYTVTSKKGNIVVLDGKDVLHLRDVSEDGIVGVSRIKLAAKALGIAFDAENAAENLFKNGVLAGGALSTPNKLSDNAYNRLLDSMAKRHKGVENAGDFMILEEGLKAEKWANSASDAQHLEQRNHQIEEVARLFGVPRPLLMMDDTSWGSGISQLGLFFHKYSLLPIFTMWEQALQIALLSPSEQRDLSFKFNADAILRGSPEEQAAYFSKALGSGGAKGWLTQNEVREKTDFPRMDDPEADKLPQQNNSKNKDKDNVSD
ncbi:phage portal protein [Alysiella crassa]|uniref:Phage portal protein, HK97 family n=1 Tax=Alysiella crassa TaxID=153491 RepID=A0A376BTK3_9NEIS|nr:phage portal protein [Alysiella crassa]SSY80312.1 phage portal protein, HK97 family [Alysiella crassa]